MFVLDDNDIAIRLTRTLEGRYEMRFPKQLINQLNNEWVYEIFFDNVSFDDTGIFIKGDEFITHISDGTFNVLEVMNGWKVGDEVGWKVDSTPEGPEVRITKIRKF